MKIEIAESLGATWIKHVKKCFMVQQNWKVSPCWGESAERKVIINQIVDKFKEILRAEEFQQYDIFGGANVDQMISQTECDVLGISTGETQNKYYALETAFHENGIQYGDKYKTSSKIVAKLFRIAITLYYYQNIRNGHVYFATPKMNPATKSVLDPLFSKMVAFFREEHFETTFEIIANNDFKTKILEPVYECADQVSDSNELFLRSLQLTSLFDDEHQIRQRPAVNVAANNDNEKIGQVVRNEMIPILQSDRVTDDEFQDLLSLEESKAQFGLSFPLLMKQDECDNGGLRIRYYATSIKKNGVNYKVCSQWFKGSLGRVRNWIMRHQENDD